MGDEAKKFSEGFNKSTGSEWFKKKKPEDDEELKRKIKEEALKSLLRSKKE